MKIHILGICGTFMAGVAILAREMGMEVSGSDAGVYPPMSTQLAAQGIDLHEGYESAHLEPAPDLLVIGNAMSRGNAMVEYALDRGIPYISGPQFIADYILKERWVLAVSGTHGKTTTSSMLAWLLEDAGLKPGFLVGGVPENFGVSARLGEDPFFVIEADEYDTAFFDKRSKFVHYRPRTLIINNLEFDHADIFENLAAIQRQFHHLVRTVPGNGLIIREAGEPNIDAVLEQGVWTPTVSFGDDADAGWRFELVEPDGSVFDVFCDGQLQGRVSWDLIGRHNVANAVAAIAAARHAGVPAAVSMEGLSRFRNVKRRLELRGESGGIEVYDDFAHHPTAIITTLDGLRQRVGERRILAVLEPRSNTMRMGVHRQQMADSVKTADAVWFYQPAGLDWSLNDAVAGLGDKARVCDSVQSIVDQIKQEAAAGDVVLVMSNGGFENIHQRLLEALDES